MVGVQIGSSLMTTLRISVGRIKRITPDRGCIALIGGLGDFYRYFEKYSTRRERDL